MTTTATLFAEKLSIIERLLLEANDAAGLGRTPSSSAKFLRTFTESVAGVEHAYLVAAARSFGASSALTHATRKQVISSLCTNWILSGKWLESLNARGRKRAHYFGTEAQANSLSMAEYRDDIAIGYGVLDWEALPVDLQREAIKEFRRGKREEADTARTLFGSDLD